MYNVSSQIRFYNDYPHLADKRAVSPKAHSIGHRPMYKAVRAFAL